MYVYAFELHNVLGEACLIERVKHWLASCGAHHESGAGKLARKNARRLRNLHVVHFLFLPFVCPSLSASEQRRYRRHSAKLVRKADEHRSKIDEKLSNIAKNPRKFSFGWLWTLRAGSGARRSTPGTPKNRPRSDLGTPQAHREWLGTVQKHPWASPEAPPDQPGTLSKHVWSIQHC